MPFALPATTKITWLGHATFLIETPNARILLDPWIKTNPSCPEAMKAPDALGQIDLMLITHGHFDHTDDAIEVANAMQCKVIGVWECLAQLMKHGLPAASADGETDYVYTIGRGGSVRFDDLNLTVTATNAIHSSSYRAAPSEDAVYAGEPCGFVVRVGGVDESADDFVFYIAGDTCVFGDMAIIAELYQPTLAFLPIGDRHTMGAKEAAHAVKLLSSSVEAVIPMHFNTFDELTGTREAFEAALQNAGVGVEVLRLEPGETLGGDSA